MAKITTTGKVLNALKKMHVNKLYRNVENLLPNWVTSKIQSVSKKHVFNPLVHEKEIKPKYLQACKYLAEKLGKENLGDYLEFGVSHGTSLSIMHKVLKESKLDQVRIFGFDSFEGMPEISAHEDKGHWKPGQFASPIEATTDYLTERGVDWKRTFLIKGWYSDTLTQALVDKHNIRKASFIMVDCDIYTSSIQALEFCKPFIKDTAIVFFDDWIDDRNFGEYKAWEEFLAANPNFKAKEFGSYQPTGKIFEITLV
jgi:hypothetical protein